MADKLLIVLMNTNVDHPLELVAPLRQAAVASAMDYRVEVVLAGRADELARPGVADTIFVQDGSGKTVYDLMRDAHEKGAVFKLCSPTPGMGTTALIPEIDEVVGDAYLISEAMDGESVTLTY